MQRSMARAFSTFSKVGLLPRTVVQGRITNVLRAFPPTPHTFGENDTFVSVMGFDRMTVKQLIQNFSEEFCVDVPYADADKMINVNTTADYFAAHPKAR